MRVDPNSHVPDPLNVSAAKAKEAPVSAPKEDNTRFTASARLTEVLENLPDTRADKIAAAKALVQNPSYPDESTLRKVANVLTDHLHPNNPA